MLSDYIFFFGYVILDKQGDNEIFGDPKELADVNGKLVYSSDHEDHYLSSVKAAYSGTSSKHWTRPLFIQRG